MCVTYLRLQPRAPCGPNTLPLFNRSLPLAADLRGQLLQAPPAPALGLLAEFDMWEVRAGAQLRGRGRAGQGHLFPHWFQYLSSSTQGLGPWQVTRPHSSRVAWLQYLSLLLTLQARVGKALRCPQL